MTALIKPHGSDTLNPLFVEDPNTRAQLVKDAASLPAVTISSAAAGNAVMLGGGYFTPLTGFMNKADALSIGSSMKTTDGLFWPTPVLNLVADANGIKAGDRIALKDPNVDGAPVLAVQQVQAVENFTEAEIETLAQQVFGTTDREHPGVAEFVVQGTTLISGPVEVLNFSYFEKDFPDTFRTAVEIRNEIANLGWKRIVAFQTRNPMHRAHEELCHMAMDLSLIHI